MKRIIVMLICLFPVFLFGEAGTESPVDELGISGASGAMGNAFTSIESPYSIVYNPSLIRADRTISFTYMHDILQYGADYDVATSVFSFGLPIDRGAKNNSIAVAYYLLSDEGIPVTEAGNDTIGGTHFVNIIYKGETSYMLSQVDFSANRRIADFSIGFLFDYVYSSMYDLKGKGYSFGGGIGYNRETGNKIVSGFGAGISYRNFSYLKWNNGVTDTLDCNFRTGVNVKVLKGVANALDDGIILSFDIVQTGSLARFSPHYLIGAEWKVFGMVPVRIGMDNGRLTAGIGFETKYIDFDYAFVSNPVIASSHKFSITGKL